MNVSTLRWHRAAALLGFAATMNLAQPQAAEPAPKALPDLGSVLGELRKGGLVLYSRHGLTDSTGATDEVADLARCETQRNLSAEGREQEAQIGKALRSLRIPVGTVTTSPFCRCKETARLAFGEFTVHGDLYFSVGANAVETKRGAESLRRMLSTAPAKATNTVIVSHSANLREAAGIWPAEGAVYVFRPLLAGKFEAIAMVPAEEWSRLAKRESSGKPR